MTGYGVYVHLPWCRLRCPYCAFVVEVDREAPFARYTDALLRAWEAQRPQFAGAPDTLAFGGGTPSLTPVADIARLRREIAPRGEVSLEANPEDIDAARLDALREAGVTRLSLGVQSFSPTLARRLGRASKVHRLDGVLSALSQAGFASWSADLIFAIPGQTLADFREDLERLLGFGPPHVSLYGLSAEEGTPYTRALELGRLEAPSDDLWAEMAEEARARLGDAGLERYEVSNYARPGHRSACNEHYWRGRPYAGLGAGAHGFWPDGRRTMGPDSAAAFLANPLHLDIERPLPRQRAVDLLLSTLRHRDGVPLDDLLKLGFSLEPAEVERLIVAGLLKRAPGALALAEAGWAVADGVTRRLCEALRGDAT